MTATEFLKDLQHQGFTFTLLPDNKLAVAPRERVTDALRAQLKKRKQGLLAALRQQSARARPYLTPRGELIVPLNAPSKYHWWSGGQSVRATLRELEAPLDVLARYVEGDLRAQQ